MGELLGQPVKLVKGTGEDDVQPERPSVFLEVDTELSVDTGNETLARQSFLIREDGEHIRITGKSENALLQGVFAFTRMVALAEIDQKLPLACTPSMPFRMLDHWDDMNGSIERGYSGRSFFYDDYNILFNDRTKMYARLAASIGINAIVINNVNVHERETYLITDTYLYEVKRYAELFASYGIQLDRKSVV